MVPFFRDYSVINGMCREMIWFLRAGCEMRYAREVRKTAGTHSKTFGPTAYRLIILIDMKTEILRYILVIRHCKWTVLTVDFDIFPVLVIRSSPQVLLWPSRSLTCYSLARSILVP